MSAYACPNFPHHRRTVDPLPACNLNRGLVTNFRFAGLLAKRDSTRVLVQVKGTSTDVSAPVVSR
jgi:hypothetical protein